MTDFAEEYIRASQQNTNNYSAPRIVFAFFDGITNSIAGQLVSIGALSLMLF